VTCSYFIYYRAAGDESELRAAVGAMQDAESDQSHVVYARGRARYCG